MQTGIQYAIAIVFIAITVGVGLITLASFATGQTGNTLNALNNGTQALTNLSIQLPVVGTIMGVALILLVLFGAIGYLVMKNQ